MQNIVIELSPWEVYRILAALNAANPVPGVPGQNADLIARFEGLIQPQVEYTDGTA